MARWRMAGAIEADGGWRLARGAWRVARPLWRAAAAAGGAGLGAGGWGRTRLLGCAHCALADTDTWCKAHPLPVGGGLPAASGQWL
jgi:hypothetical protein